MEGKLRRPYKVLFLPQTHALNPNAAEAIAHFARRGGTVVADIVPGRFDHHLAPLRELALASFFAQGGRAILFNYDLAAYERARGEALDERDTHNGAALRRDLAALLAKAGVRCPVQMQVRKEGQAPVRVELVRWRRGSVELLGVFHYPIGFWDNAPASPPARVRLCFDPPTYAHLVGAAPEAAGPSGEIELEIPPGRMKFVVTSPEAIKPLRMEVAPRTAQTLAVSLKGAAGHSQPAHLVAVGQDGKALPWFDEIVVLEGGAATVQVPLAVDGDPQLKAIRVTDWFSGKTQEIAIR